jgi:hypothetical protein
MFHGTPQCPIQPTSWVAVAAASFPGLQPGATFVEPLCRGSYMVPMPDGIGILHCLDTSGVRNNRIITVYASCLLELKMTLPKQLSIKSKLGDRLPDSGLC